jgi:hypothetical protein
MFLVDLKWWNNPPKLTVRWENGILASSDPLVFRIVDII